MLKACRDAVIQIKKKIERRKTGRKAKNTSQPGGWWSSWTQAGHLRAAEPSWIRVAKPLLREGLLAIHPDEGSGQAENSFTRKGLTIFF